MLGKTYALAGRIVNPKTIPAVGVGVEKLMENWVSHPYFAGLFHSTTKTNQVKDLFYYRFCSAFGIDLFQRVCDIAVPLCIRVIQSLQQTGNSRLGCASVFA